MAPFLGLETGLLIPMLIAILLQKYVCFYQVTCIWKVRKCPIIVSYYFSGMGVIGPSSSKLGSIDSYPLYNP